MFYIAIPKDDKYVIVLGQSFGIRSNAAKYAERMGWRDFFVATEEQRILIESGATEMWETGGSSVYGHGYKVDLTVPAKSSQEQETINPDSKWMKDEGIPWDKKGRKAKKK